MRGTSLEHEDANKNKHILLEGKCRIGFKFGCSFSAQRKGNKTKQFSSNGSFSQIHSQIPMYVLRICFLTAVYTNLHQIEQAPYLYMQICALKKQQVFNKPVTATAGLRAASVLLCCISRHVS